MKEKLRVRNWDKFQHYRDRNPPWIKLHTRLLEDYDFQSLTDVEKGQIVLIWLLASRMDNSIPADPEWIQRKIGATDPVNIRSLVSSGFLEFHGDCKQNASTMLAKRLHGASTETEREKETETEEELNPRARTRVGADSETTQKPKSTPPRPTGSKKTDSIPFESQIPENLQTPEFRSAWIDWIQDRSNRRKRVTEKAAGLQLAKLSQWGASRAVQSIRESIESGWQGLFEPKHTPPPTQTPRNTPETPPRQSYSVQQVKTALGLLREIDPEKATFLEQGLDEPSEDSEFILRMWIDKLKNALADHGIEMSQAVHGGSDQQLPF